MRDEGWEKFFFDTEQTPEIELHIIQRSSMKYQIEKYSIPEGGSQLKNSSNNQLKKEISSSS